VTQEPKRIEEQTASIAVGNQTSVSFGPGTGTILRRLVNYHNIWGSFTAEPENADVNANGIWVLWMKPDATQADVAFDIVTINSNDFNQMIIACGTWGASNQFPFTKEIHLNSSRNMVANQELILTVRVEGLSAGLIRLRLLLCAGLSVK